MKRTKLLFPILACLSMSSAITVASCGDGKTEAQKIAEAIINPIDLKAEKITKTFAESLKELKSDDLKKELIYDLFGLFNIKGKYNLEANDSFGSLYKDNKVAIQTNITKCGLEFNKEGKLISNFLGYVSFVFGNDYKDKYKANDYVMLTFDLSNVEVQIDETNCSLKYEIKDSKYENPCIGFAKIKYNGGSEVMQYIENIDTNLDYQTTVKNSHNWTK